MSGQGATTAVRLVLAPEERSPRRARQLVASVLREAGFEHLLDDALLLVSELVTNAVVHAGTQVEVEVRLDGSGLTVEVCDSVPGGMRFGAGLDTNRTGGRGFQLVDALADGWGTQRDAAHKTVWFRLGDTGLRAEPPATATLGPTPAQPPRRDISFLLGPADLEQRVTPTSAVEELLRRSVEGLGRARGWVYAVGDDDAGSATTWVLRAEYDDSLAPDPEAVRRGLPLDGAGVCQPFVGADGEHAGALVLSGGVPDGEEAALIRLAALRIGGVLRDERAQTVAGRVRGSSALLVEASEMLAGVLDVRLAATLTAHLAVPRLAHWAAVWTAFGTDLELEAVAHSSEGSGAVVERCLHEPVISARVEDVAVRASTRRLAESSGGGVLSFVDGGLGELGEGWLIPLYSRRRLLGLFAVAGAPGRAPADPTLLTNLGRIAALALDNARLYSERAAIAEALQSALLPAELPVGVGVEFAARYAPGGDGTEVGGDFYDVFDLGDRGWGVTIGDVCGKGASAAAITGVAREVLRVLLRDGLRPAAALARLHESLLGMGDRGRLCTLVVGVLRPDGPDLLMRLSIAGHPPPVLVRRDGEVVPLDYGGTVLGAIKEVVLSEEEIRLTPGESLVLYTDGITERRGPAGMFGEAKLMAALREAPRGTANGLAEAVHAAAQAHGGPAAPHDDLAVLVIRASESGPSGRDYSSWDG